MKIKSGMPSVQLNVKQVTFPWQEKPSDLEFNIGKIEFEIEGDAKELVLHSTSFFTNIKDMVDYIRETVHEEEDRTEEKRNYIQTEIDHATSKIEDEYKHRIDSLDREVMLHRTRNTELRIEFSNLKDEFDEFKKQAEKDVAAAFSRGLSGAEPLLQVYRSAPCVG